MEYNIVPNENNQKMTIKGKPEMFLIVFISIWGSMFVSPLLSFPFVIYNSLYATGTKTLKCQHNTPKKVICKQTSERLLGVAKSEETIWQNVTKADFHLVTKKIGRDSRNTTKQWITLKTNEKEINIFNDDGYSNLNNMETEELKSWVENFNKFVNSNEEKIVLIYPISQQWINVLPLFLVLLFPVIGLGVIYTVLQWHSLIFDRSEQSLIWEIQTILGKQNYKFSLMDIREIKITKVRGNKGRTFYHVNIHILGKDNAIPLVSASLEIAQNMAVNLGEFLHINVQDLTDRWS